MVWFSAPGAEIARGGPPVVLTVAGGVGVGLVCIIMYIVSVPLLRNVLPVSVNDSRCG